MKLATLLAVLISENGVVKAGWSTAWSTACTLLLQALNIPLQAFNLQTRAKQKQQSEESTEPWKSRQ